MHSVLLTLTLVALCGCAMTRTPYEPGVETPAQWRTPTATADPLPERWWQAFDDSRLNALIDDVLDRNGDLGAAAIDVHRARLLARLAERDRGPQFDGSLGGSASRAVDGPPTSRSFGASLGVSYELDLWNRLGSLADAARWVAFATEQDRDALLLTTIGTTASLYFEAAFLEERLALDDASLDVTRRTLALVEVQYDAGSVSSLELAEARRSLLTQEALRTARVHERAAVRNALGVLLDGRDMSSRDAATLDTITIPAVDAGTPARLLARRPDLRAQEARLRALLADADAVDVSFYPTIALIGDAGTSSAALRDIFSNPVGAVAASIALPFLNIERARLTRAAARSSYDAAVLSFKSALLRALAEVEDALSLRDQLVRQQDLLARALTNAQDAERIYDLRYRAGSVALRDLLAAQEARRTVEANLLDNKLQRLLNHIVLCQALGGDAG